MCIPLHTLLSDILQYVFTTNVPTQQLLHDMQIQASDTLWQLIEFLSFFILNNGSQVLQTSGALSEE